MKNNLSDKDEQILFQNKSYQTNSYQNNSYHNNSSSSLNPYKTVIEYMPLKIADLLEREEVWRSGEVIEIRLRVNQALQLITYDNELFPGGGQKPFILSRTDLEQAFMILCKNSVYALERQLAEGFLTIKGGHRVGFTGQAVIENGKLKTIKNISSLNYRITRELIGTAAGIINKLYNHNYDIYYNTLIIAPPLCGKTTLLRDLVRLISDGDRNYRIKGKKVAVVDERSEIGGAYNGVPQNKIGSRTDLMDNCPKAEGILLLIRSMSPEVIAVDEIGRDEDARAIEEALNAGVSVISTVHGASFNGVRMRPSIRQLIDIKAFDRYIILSKRGGIGTVEKILDNDGREVS